MMAQEDLANVWILLQERIDVGHIIPEIIGHFALSSLGKSPSAAHSFSIFVWIKVIFDLQRTYSQSSTPSLETQTYLIQPQILLTAIYYVLDTKSRLYPCRPEMDEDTLAQRYFVARVLHSGLRALQLRRKINDRLSIQEIEDINAIDKLIQSWWVEAARYADEQFILRKCQTAISKIRQGPRTNSIWNRPGCGSCELRDNQNSLWHALTGKIEDAFEKQLSKLRADDEPPFWALFDILWAAEVGYIQWCADKLSGKEVAEYKSEVHILRDKIKNPVLEPSALTVLLHGWSQDLETPDPLLPGIGHSLKSFHSFLQNRQAKLVDCDLAITKLSGELLDEIESWIQGSGYREHVDLRDPKNPPLDTAYVLGCPKAHVVPELELRTFVENRRPDFTHIFNNSELLDIGPLQMQCPLCSPTVVVKHARMIDPLNYLSGRLRRLAEASKESRDSLAFQVPQMPEVLLPAYNSLARNPSSNSSIESVAPLTPSSSPPPFRPPAASQRTLSADSQSITSDTIVSAKGKSSRLNKVWSWGKRSSGETPRKPVRVPSVAEVKPACSFDRYCFSTDGNVLILWNSGKKHIFASTIPTQDGHESDSMWNWNTFEVPGLMLVAGGGDMIAGISKVGNQQKLLVFSAPHPSALLDQILPHVGQIRSITVSSCGNYVAVASDGQVSIYAVNDPLAKPKPIMLSNQASPVDSQRVNFSPDGNKVAIVTRHTNGQIDLILHDRLKEQEIWQRKPIDSGQITDNDHGLSTIFYDTKKRRIILTAYINKPFSVVHSSRHEFVPWSTQKGKIQAAAQSPSRSQYILLTAAGRLYQLDLETMAPVLLNSRWYFKGQPQSPDQFAALAMPEDDLIYAFRIDNNEMILEVIRGDNMPMRKIFPAPLCPDG